MFDKVSNQSKNSVFNFTEDTRQTAQSNEGNPFDVLFDKTPPPNNTPSMKSEWRQQRKEAKAISRKESWEDLQKDLFNNGTLGYIKGNSHLRKATAANITEEGGSGNMIGCQNQNTIFKGSLADKLSASGREKTLDEKTKIAEHRNQLENEYRASNGPDVVEDNIIPNSSSVSPISGGQRDGGWGVTSGSISMFDKGEFSRLKPTAGENMETRQSKKDDSWKSIESQRSKSTRQIQSNIVDGFSSESETRVAKTRSQSIVDTLYDSIIKERKSK